MEDQFGGRTDDDLFYDDYEPVDGETVVVEDAPQHQPPTQPVSAPTQPSTQEQTRPAPAPARVARGLESSRYADPAPAPQPAPQPAVAPSPPVAQQAPPQESQPAPQQPPTQEAPSSEGPPLNAPTGPREKTQPRHQTGTGNGKDNTAAVADREARLQSGANPRQKLTDAELTKKMQDMKLLSAEKTRKFEKAEQDEKQHAQAYARGMQEARVRQAELEKKKQHEKKNQQQLNTEREKNRERKLKAMSLKEGGWDEGKEAAAREDARRTFKGANGGIRGSRRGGLGGGRVLQEGEELPDVDRFLDDRTRQRGRGRGRGGPGAGAGGRGGRPAAPAASNTKQAIPKTEDFPALPTSGNKDAAAAPKANPEPILSPLPKGSKWDDEMEALDELKQKS